MVTAKQARLNLIAMLNVDPACVYLNPPNEGINYPCVIMRLDGVSKDYANDRPYVIDKSYRIDVIDYSQNSSLNDAVINLPKSSWVTQYTKGALHHFVHNVYL